MTRRKQSPPEDDLNLPQSDLSEWEAEQIEQIAKRRALKESNSKKPKPKTGRPSKYAPRYCADLIKWFSDKDYYSENRTDKGNIQILPGSRLPTIEGFAANCGVDPTTLYEWAEKHVAFSRSMGVARALQADLIQAAASAGALPPNFAQLMMINNHGWQSTSGAAARKQGEEEGEKGGDDLPEASAFRLVVVRDRDDAHYQLWCDAREKAKLRGTDIEAAGDDFLLYDDADAEQLKEVAKVKGHLLGLLEMLGDD